MIEERIKAITNLVVVIALLVNALLTAAGKNPLPFDENELSEAIAYAGSFASALLVWWKNNNMTPESSSGQVVTDEMKHLRDEPDGTGDPEGGEEE